ncbi:AAA family ATPase [Solihabitans fulvus]|uniref:AAA family ATPase n=1 Tax=Solihabitans fulvus TaxID=1892852 RepID=A0A5B2WPS6_9PSEU|nr:helix-turn-helix transcriptional regulator [Solihabitans fulvus]KAA2252429.1 AAA family ATPase [Solihabitans fulvus]
MSRVVVSPVFVGRDEQLAALTAACHQSITEGATVALIAGEAGIGKSRMVEEFGRRLTDARAITGECLELGADGLPYAPFVAIVRRLVRELGAARVAALTPDDGQALAAWLPALGTPADGDGLAGKGRLFEEVLALFEGLAAEHPTVVVVEDLHWADPATRELFLFLARNLQRPGIMIVGTYRTEEAAPLRPLLSGLGRGARTYRLTLERFSRSEVGRQLSAIHGREADPATVTRIHQRSDGIPLFVEALDGAGDATPDSLRDLLLSGLTQLPDRCRSVLRAASAIGIKVPHALLTTAIGLDELALEEALRPLIERELLLVADDGYAFRHALIRGAVYEGLLPGERTRLHTRCAEALLADGSQPAELAAHWYAAGNPVKALAAAWEAAAAAARSYAYAEQLRMLERVLELWRPESGPQLGIDHATVLERAVDACLHAGEIKRGIELVSAALAELTPATAPERAAALLEIRGRLKLRTNTDGNDDLQAALRLLPADEPNVIRGRVLSILASVRLMYGDLAAAGPLAEETVRIGRLTGDRLVLARGLTSVASYRVASGDEQPWEPPIAEAAELAEQAGDIDLLMTITMNQCRLLAEFGQHEQCATAARHAIALGQRFGLERSRGAMLATHLAESQILLGHWRDARDVLLQALSVDPPVGYRAALLLLRGQLDTVEGDAEAAATALAEVESIVVGGPSPDMFLAIRIANACQLAAAQGDLGGSVQVLRQALSSHDMSTLEDPWRLLPVGARMLRDAGARNPDVADIRAEVRALVERLPARGPYLAARQAMALAELDGGDLSTWDTVVAQWRTLTQPYETAQSLARAAEAAIVAGDRPAAQTRLREAAEIAARLGAVPLAREIAALGSRGRLDRSGAESTAVPSESSEFGLTPRERDVLTLIAKGLSNRQIAQELFISPNTAGVHVSRILPKLGAASRTEAAAIAHRAGLDLR